MENQLATAKEESNALTAPVKLPSDMSVKLVPSYLLEHLDEVRSDESIAYLLIGVFAGAEAGFVVNWATTEKFTMTRPSQVFCILFGVLLVGSIVWAWQLRKRSQGLKDKMFGNSK
jgi:H+/Cl- antiporter ClcA